MNTISEFCRSMQTNILISFVLITIFLYKRIYLKIKIKCLWSYWQVCQTFIFVACQTLKFLQNLSTVFNHLLFIRKTGFMFETNGFYLSFEKYTAASRHLQFIVITSFSFLCFSLVANLACSSCFLWWRNMLIGRNRLQ